MKSPLVGVRVPENIKEKLEKMATVYNDVSISQVARTAIVEWVEAQWMRHEDMMIIPKDNFSFLLQLLPEDKLELFEDNIVNKVIFYFEYITLEKNQNIKGVEEFTYEMIRFIGNSGLRWFERMEIEINPTKEPMFFKGMHSMGAIWSKVFLDIYKKILEKHEVDFIIKENSIIINEKLVYFEMEPRKSALPHLRI